MNEVWVVLCMICFALGRLSGFERKGKPPDKKPEPDERLQRQLNNFWAYDGTEGGQIELED